MSDNLSQIEHNLMLANDELTQAYDDKDAGLLVTDADINILIEKVILISRQRRRIKYGT